MAIAEFDEKGRLKSDEYYSSPTSQRGQTSITKFVTAGAIGTSLLGLSSLTLTGTVMALIMVTPVLVLFSPILVPAAIVMSLAAAGFVLSGVCGMAAVAALAWLYKYASNYVEAKRREHAYGSLAQIGL